MLHAFDTVLQHDVLVGVGGGGVVDSKCVYVGGWGGGVRFPGLCRASANPGPVPPDQRHPSVAVSCKITIWIPPLARRNSTPTSSRSWRSS